MVGIAVDAGAVTAVSIGETICTGNRHLRRILGIGCGMA